MKSSLLPLPRLLAAILLIALSASSVFAQKEYTYSPSGPVTFRTKFGGVKTQIVSITNTTQQPTFLKIKFIGDTSFKFSYSQTEYLWIGADSTANFTVTYLASNKDTSIGWLRMYDSINTADTIKFMGMDTIYVEPPPPPAWKIDTAGSSFIAGSYFGLSDTASIRVKNLTDHPISIYSTPLSGVFLAIGAGQRTIAAGSTSDFKYYFNPGYDSAASAIKISDNYRADTIRLFAKAYRPPAYDSLWWTWYTYFFPELPGDTLCQDLTIYNRFDSDAVITALDFEDPNYFYLRDAPNFPLLVAAHDSLKITICFPSPDSAAFAIYSGVHITYQFDSTNSRTRYASLRGYTRKCLWMNPNSLGLGLVRRDSTRTRSFYLVNYTHSAILIDSLRLRADSDPGFEVTPNTSITLPPSDSVLIEVTYIAEGDSTQDAYVNIYTQDRCHDIPAYHINASVYDESVEGIRLFGDSTNTLNFSGDSSFAIQVFHFINDLSDSINVTWVGLKHGTHFQIYDIAPHMPQILLAPTDWMDVTLQFIGTPGVYDDTLMIVAENAFVALNFPIHAVISGSSVDAPRVAAPSLRVSPNPAVGPVTITIDRARSASIEVLDVMGTQVARIGDGAWDHPNVASGAYFIRATGVGEDGKPFVTTSRIVLE